MYSALFVVIGASSERESFRSFGRRAVRDEAFETNEFVPRAGILLDCRRGRCARRSIESCTKVQACGRELTAR